MSLTPYTCAVEPQWIDYNGHMSEAFYVLAFGFATTAVMDALGLDEDYRQTASASLYTVEAHVRYLDEVSPGATLEITTVIAGHGAKKLHLAHEMHVDGSLVATEEILGLHVDTESGSTSVFPTAINATIASHEHRIPDWSGRSIST